MISAPTGLLLISNRPDWRLGTQSPACFSVTEIQKNDAAVAVPQPSISAGAMHQKYETS
jgi:hypothetical protein